MRTWSLVVTRWTGTCCLLALTCLGPGAARAASSSLEGWLESRVQTLTRSVHTYHYATRARMSLPSGYIAPHNTRLQPYLISKVERFWDPAAPISAGATVGGLYVATDPIVGRAFGGSGDGWALVEVVLDPGFRFLDVRDGGWSGPRQRERALPVTLRQELASSGCEVEYPFELFLMLESRSCRETALRLLAALEVDGVLYSFHRFDFPSCGDRADGAFVVLRPDRLRFGSSRLFTHVREPDEADPQRRQIQALFARAREAGSTRELPWEALEPAASEGFNSWMRRSIFGCGAYPEDAPSQLALAGQASITTPSPPVRADDPYLQRAREFVAAGDLRQAIAEYEQILQEVPDDAPALDGLSWILATAADRELRDPVRAIWLGEEMVRITHYRDRKAWSKAYKVRAAHTLAVAHASGGSFDRAVDYTRWSVEVAGRLHGAQNAEWSEKLLRHSEELLKLFKAEEAFEPAPDFVRLEVPWH